MGTEQQPKSPIVFTVQIVMNSRSLAWQIERFDSESANIIDVLYYSKSYKDTLDRYKVLMMNIKEIDFKPIGMNMTGGLPKMDFIPLLEIKAVPKA